jgi:signal transduction histidine kinase
VLPSLPFFFSDFRHDRWDPVEAFTRLEGPAASFDEEEVRRLRSVRRYASVLQPNTFPHSSARRRPGEGNWKPGRYLAPARIRHRDAQQSAHLPVGMPYERQIWWHKFFGTIAAFSTTVHVSELQNKSSEKQERELKREKREKRERERERIQERKSYWGN